MKEQLKKQEHQYFLPQDKERPGYDIPHMEPLGMTAKILVSAKTDQHICFTVEEKFFRIGDLIFFSKDNHPTKKEIDKRYVIRAGKDLSFTCEPIINPYKGEINFVHYFATALLQ